MAKKENAVIGENNQTQIVNYQQAHAGARSIKMAASTLNQARKALSGIENESIVIGRNTDKEKLYTTIGSFMSAVGCPYVKGQVSLKSILDTWAPFLKDDKGNPMLCRNVTKRVRVGKSTYPLYHEDDKGHMKLVQVYEPAPVSETGWDPYKICEGLAQSKFLDETVAMYTESLADYERMKKNHDFYVKDALTGGYLPVRTIDKGDSAKIVPISTPIMDKQELMNAVAL